MVVINQPEDYDLFPGNVTSLSTEHDAIFIFVETIEEMISSIQRINTQQPLLEKGYLYFAYPKKGNKRYETFIHRDEIFPALNVGKDGFVGNSDLKFSRMVSMDEVFTVVGLKRENKRSKKSSAASQCVADYEQHIKDVKGLLAKYSDELQFYQGLTPGYQKDWARYIFSAKQQETRDKRQQQMINILSQGYKSVDLYRKEKK